MEVCFAADPFFYVYRDITTHFGIQHLCFSLGNSPYVRPESRRLPVHLTVITHNMWLTNEKGFDFALVRHQEFMSENLWSW